MTNTIVPVQSYASEVVQHPRMSEYVEDNRHLIQPYAVVLAAWKVNAGDMVRASWQEGDFPRERTAPEDGYLVVGRGLHMETHQKFLTRAAFEEQMIPMGDAPLVLPREDMPENTVIHRINSHTYHLSTPGRPGGRPISPYQLHIQFNESASLPRLEGVEFFTVARAADAPFEGLVLPVTTKFFQPSGLAYVREAGTFIYANPATPDGYDDASPEFTRFSLRHWPRRPQLGG